MNTLIREIPIDKLKPEDALFLATEAAKKLLWTFETINEGGFTALGFQQPGSNALRMVFKMEVGFATLQAESFDDQHETDRLKRSVEEFILVFEELASATSSETREMGYEKLRSEFMPSSGEMNLQEEVTEEKFGNIFSIFIPTQGYFITPILIILNILIFLLMSISGVNIMEPDNESLISWGANFRPVTMEGEWWRLITCCFLHIGIFHLLLNMYALLYIGLMLEPHLGRVRFLSAYLLTGVISSVTSLWWHNLTISAGASGAIFGMYGVFITMLTTNLIENSMRRQLLSSIGIFVIINLIYGLKGGIDNAAHIGGLVSGLIVGYAFLPSLKDPSGKKMKYSSVALLSVATLLLATIVYNSTSNDFGKYQEKMKSFESNEAAAIEVLMQTKDKSKEELLADIVNRGIYKWNENINLVNEADKMDLPAEIHERNKKLILYCDLRLKSYDLIYKAISENTYYYDDSIEYYISSIEKVINDLKEN